MRMDESQKELIAEYASLQGKSMADFMIEAAMDVIEDAIDLREWEATKAAFDADPVSYSSDGLR